VSGLQGPIDALPSMLKVFFIASDGLGKLNQQLKSQHCLVPEDSLWIMGVSLPNENSLDSELFQDWSTSLVMENHPQWRYQRHYSLDGLFFLSFLMVTDAVVWLCN
jgi:hypothetical protein